MKKITLAAFATLAYVGSVFGQANIVVQAPSTNSSSQLRVPNGMIDTKYQNACYLVRGSEINGLTASVINSIGFKLLDGTGTVPVTGNFTVYLQNTNDITYNKGTNFTTVLTGMSTNFVGNITMPATANAATITLNLTTNFNWTGGGIYVAFTHDAAGPFDPANPSTIEANSTLVNGGATASSSTTPYPTAMTLSNFRPAFLFGAVNTATNEVSVSNLVAPGKVAKSLNTGHVITVDVKNGSIGTLTNIAVGLAVTGANAFTNSQTVASLAPGAVTTVSFTSFNPQNSGLNTVAVSVLPDQFPANNSATWSQSVTCSTMATNPPTGTYTNGIGFPSATGCIINKIKAPASDNLASLRIAIATNTQNPGQQVYGVILSSAGAVIATTNTITIGSAMLGTFQTFNFLTPQAIIAGTDYYIGIAQPNSGFYPIAILDGSPSVPGYFSCPLAGGAFTSQNFGYFGIEAVFTSTNPVLSVAPSRTLVCKGESVVLTASGGSTYVWSNNATGPSITVNPIVTTAYAVTGTDANGCSNSKSYTLTISPCLGLTANSNDGTEILVFPNPAANGKTTISGLTGSNSISVFNLLGQQISTQSSSEESVNIDFSNQPAGNYLIKITNTYGQTKTLKIVNQN